MKARRPVIRFVRRVVEGLIGFAAVVVGRRRMIRLTRFVTNVLRYDHGNQIDSNGEQMIQQIARTDGDPVVFDVGANKGQWSSALLEQSGGPVRLVAFEPSAYTHAILTETLGAKAEVHQLALSDHPGTAELHIVAEGAGVNSLVEQRGVGKDTTTETVQVDTVDAFCQKAGIAQITLLKVDAEGADLSVLRGAREMFASGAVAVAQFEYNWRWIGSRTYLKDVFDLAADWGNYTVAKVTPEAIEVYPAWHQELETFRESNYVIVRNDWLGRFPTIEWWGG